MNGRVFDAGKFCFSLRKRLMEEHLGLLENSYHPPNLETPISVIDPVVASFYTDIWCSIANKNSQIYEKVFNCFPTNSVRLFISVYLLDYLPNNRTLRL